MRKLVVLRGIAGCGKSTFVKEHHLKNYTLCPDELRLLFNSPALDVNGSMQISQEKNGKVFSLLYTILESRMNDGEFTVIDGTNLTNDDFSRYKKLARKYRYKIYCIDFSDVPFETICERNQMRSAEKVIPIQVLEKMRDKLMHNSIPGGIIVLKPNEFENILMQPIDLSQYKKIHHFGDIHGCYTALKEYLDSVGGIKEDEYYIFCGDYIDRGIENGEVIRFLSSIKDYKNVQLIQGNHEIHLMKYIHGEKALSSEFNDITTKELIDKGISKKELSLFCNKLTQCAYYKYHDKIVIATHGGLSTIPENLVFVATKQMVKGVGKYSEYEEVAKAFSKSTDKNTYQVNGHRNILSHPIVMKENEKDLRCFNLEGEVEQGGYLRVLTLDSNGFKPIEIKNNVFKEQRNQVLFEMRHNTLVKEKTFDEISSFNFTRSAFENNLWNKETIKARGLYLNNQTGEVVCRGYEKFFAVDERPESSIGFIKNNYQFPLTAYVKENGYLGLVSYREQTDELFITTKSDPTGDYAIWFKNLLSDYDLKKLKEYVKMNNCTFIFEVIDIKHDPHIIKYDKNKIVLLDVVDNNIETFNRRSYEELCTIASEFNFEAKRKAIILDTFDEFIAWYKKVIDTDYTYENNFIEGFVIEDTLSHMCKIKTQYYKCWKYLRGRTASIIARNLNFEQVQCSSQMLNYQMMNDFLKWFCENKNDISASNIIDIRDIYES